MFKSFWYLASPYTKYEWGFDAAVEHVARIAANLEQHGVHVFSPIVHGHALSKYLPEETRCDLDFWLEIDCPFIRSADGMLIAMMKGWDRSTGIARERDMFTILAKPIVELAHDFTLLPPELTRHLS